MVSHLKSSGSQKCQAARHAAPLPFLLLPLGMLLQLDAKRLQLTSRGRHRRKQQKEDKTYLTVIAWHAAEALVSISAFSSSRARASQSSFISASDKASRRRALSQQQGKQQTACTCFQDSPSHRVDAWRK